MTNKPVKLTQPRHLLARILDEPQLVTIVQNLEAEVLGKVINHIGLEDAGEIVALATTEQLTQVFDEDLWRMDRPGKEETFDAERFGVWLEIMLEMGASYAAKRLTEMDEDFVTFALARHVIVINVDELTPHMSDLRGGGYLDDEDLIDKALESSLCHQFEEYLVISKHHDGWDSILEVLVALDSDHYDFLERVIERLCYISTEYIEDNGGLYDVLTADEMLESDVAFEREKRREQEGFVPPQAAASFLGLARISKLEEMMESREKDPVTKAHFRAYAPRVRGAAAKAAAASRQQGPREDASTSGVEQFMQVLEEAGVVEESRQQLLLESGGAGEPQEEQELLLRDGLQQLGSRDPNAPLERMKELNYLANVLMSGCNYEDRSFRPFEAAKAVLAVCNLGLERMLAPAEDAARAALVERAGALLLEHDLVKMFRIGWHIQHHAVLVHAAQTLRDTLGKHVVGVVEDELAAGEIRTLCARLEKHLAAGKPWLARPRIDILDVLLDDAEVTALSALLDECPRVPRLAGKGTRRKLTSDLDFISSQRQLDDARWVVDKVQKSLRKAAKKR